MEDNIPLTLHKARNIHVYDCIVVGAGIEGSSTAYQLAKKKYKTLLLEQFLLPHTRGSSHGQLRIIRYAYDTPEYANMMKEAYPMWHQLEKETNTKLYRQTGLLVLQEAPHDILMMRLQNVKHLNMPTTELSSNDINSRYLGVHYGEDYKGFVDHKAGVLMADKCLLSYQEQFVKFGGKLHDGEKVEEIIPGVIVTVKTNRGQYRARSVVLTAGPWSSDILKPLGLNPPLMTWRVNVCYWKEKQPGMFMEFPAFVELTSSSDRYMLPGHPMPKHFSVLHGLPSISYPGMMKIAYHTGNKQVLPDNRDKVAKGDQPDIGVLQRYIKDHFPGLEDEPAILECCMYTKTPDYHFILDTHPVYPNIVIGCGMSGHGFKLAPVVGKILSELAMGLPPSYQLEMFSLERFDKATPMSSKL